MPGGALPVPEGNTIIPLINRLMPLFPFVIASLDWHPRGHISFASTHGLNVGDVISTHGYLQHLWPDHCVQNTSGAKLCLELDKQYISHYIHKGVDPLVD